MNHQTRRDDLPDTLWASDALCVDMPAEIFAGTNARLQTAKAACAHCAVARQCLRWAITTEIEDEVWGGRTPAERRRITVAFVLDPPAMSSAPGMSRPVDPVGPEIPSEPIAEPLRRVGQGVRPKKLSSPASTDAWQRSVRMWPGVLKFCPCNDTRGSTQFITRLGVTGPRKSVRRKQGTPQHAVRGATQGAMYCARIACTS